jgi:hypothetical protein
MDVGVTGQAIIEELINNMHQGLEPLHYTTLVPSLYNIHLHPDDYDRLQPIFHIISLEAQHALDDEVRKLNKKSGWLKPRKMAQPVGRWIIMFHKDLDDDVRKGEILIDSQLGMPPRVEFAGSQTKVVKTLRSMTGESTTVARSYETVGRVYASITYEDERGRQVYKMTKPEIVVGRGGKNYHTDLRLFTSPDVSREHLRIRYDPQANLFLVRDLSTLGTTVNGRAIPSSVEVAAGARRDKNVEIPIPPKARICLADVLTLEFEAAGGG